MKHDPQDPTPNADVTEALEQTLLEHLVRDEDVEAGVKALLRYHGDIDDGTLLDEADLERQLGVIVGWLYEVEMGIYLRDMLRKGIIDRLHVPEGVEDPRDIHFVFSEEVAASAEDHLDAMRRAITASMN